MISVKDLMLIMKHNNKKGFSTEGIHHLCDSNVYKLNTRQAFRHSLSNKIFNANKIEIRSGNILNDLPPSTQIVQIRGNEKLITKKEWSKHFKINEKQQTMKPITNKELLHNDVEINEKTNDLGCVDKLIILNEEELLELINEFPPRYEYFEFIAGNLLHSPYELEFIENILEKFYNRREHSNGFPDKFIQYYEKVESNQYLFSIINHLDKEKREEY